MSQTRSRAKRIKMVEKRIDQVGLNWSLSTMERERPSRVACPGCGTLHCWRGARLKENAGLYPYSGRTTDSPLAWLREQTPRLRPGKLVSEHIWIESDFTPEHVSSSPEGFYRVPYSLRKGPRQTIVAMVLSLEKGITPDPNKPESDISAPNGVFVDIREKEQS